MSDEIEVTPTENDAGGTGDALAAFVAEEEEVIPRQKAKEDKPEPKPKAEAKPREERAKAAKLDEEPGDKDEKAEDKPAEEKPPEKRRIRVKLDGKDEEVDEDEVARGYQRARDYTKKTQELAAERKKVAEFMDLVDKDPAQAFQRLGKGEAFTKAAEKAVLDLYAKEFGEDGKPLTPEQRRIRELEADLGAKRAAEQNAADKAREAEEGQEREQKRQHWTRTIVKALETAKMPKHLTSRVGSHLADAISNDITIDPADFIDDAIRLSWEDVETEHKALFDAMPDADFKARYPDLIERARKIIVADYKARQAKPAPEAVEREGTERRSPKRRVMSVSQAVADFASGR